MNVALETSLETLRSCLNYRKRKVYVVRDCVEVEEWTAYDLLVSLLPDNPAGGKVLKIDLLRADDSYRDIALFQSVDSGVGYRAIGVYKSMAQAEGALMRYALSYVKEGLRGMTVFSTRREASANLMSHSQKRMFRKNFMYLDTYDRVSIIMGLASDYDRRNRVSEIVAVALGIRRAAGSQVLYERPSLSQLTPAKHYEIYCELKDKNM